MLSMRSKGAERQNSTQSPPQVSDILHEFFTNFHNIRSSGNTVENQTEQITGLYNSTVTQLRALGLNKFDVG